MVYSVGSAIVYTSVPNNGGVGSALSKLADAGTNVTDPAVRGRLAALKKDEKNILKEGPKGDTYVPAPKTPA